MSIAIFIGNNVPQISNVMNSAFCPTMCNICRIVMSASRGKIWS